MLTASRWAVCQMIEAMRSNTTAKSLSIFLASRIAYYMGEFWSQPPPKAGTATAGPNFFLYFFPNFSGFPVTPR